MLKFSLILCDPCLDFDRTDLFHFNMSHIITATNKIQSIVSLVYLNGSIQPEHDKDNITHDETADKSGIPMVHPVHHPELYL